MRAKAVLLLLLAFLFLVPVTQAIDVEPQPTVRVVVHGELTHISDPDLRVLLQAFAVGTPDSQQGGASFASVNTNPNGQLGWSSIPIDSVLVRENEVVMSGVVERSTDPELMGASVSIMADGSSGEISLTITRVDGLSQTFQGIGLVKITGICLTQGCPEPQPTFAVAVQGKLSQVEDPETIILLEAFALVFSDTDNAYRLAEQSGSVVEDLVARHNESELLVFENLSETVVVLKGSVNRSLDPDLLRTPVSITADSSNGEIVFVFGPIPAGRLVGQTFTFKGTGTVVIRCLTC